MQVNKREIYTFNRCVPFLKLSEDYCSIESDFPSFSLVMAHLISCNLNCIYKYQYNSNQIYAKQVFFEFMRNCFPINIIFQWHYLFDYLSISSHIL